MILIFDLEVEHFFILLHTFCHHITYAQVRIVFEKHLFAFGR